MKKGAPRFAGDPPPIIQVAYVNTGPAANARRPHRPLLVY